MSSQPISALERQQIQVITKPTFWHHVRYEVVRRVIVKSRNTNVTDIGAGAGGLGDHLLLRAPSIEYRFEESSALLSDALMLRFGVQARGSGYQQFSSGSAVSLLDVLEHVEDDAAMLAEIADRMQPGARLVLTVPAMSWLFSAWDRDLGHFRRYSRRSITSVVEGTGLRVDEASYLFPELVPVAILRKLLRPSPKVNTKLPAAGRNADFPTLPNMVDRVLRAVATATARFRKLWPIGTSVFVVATKQIVAE